MNKERLLKYLNNMNTALDYIIQDTEGKEFQEFIQDRVSRQAVQLNLLILIENSVRINDGFPDFISQYPEVNLLKSKRTRNIIAHEYEEVNLAIVYSAAKHEIPALKKVIVPIIHHLTLSPVS